MSSSVNLTRAAGLPSSVIDRAASRIDVSGSRIKGSRSISALSRIRLRSGSACAVSPVRTSRSRRLEAMYAAPAGWPRTRSAGSRGMKSAVESSWAITLKAGARPLSSDGCPKHSPGSRVSTT